MSRKLTTTALQRPSKQSWRSTRSSNPSKSTLNSKTKIKAAIERPIKSERNSKRESEVIGPVIEQENEAPKSLKRETSADTVNVKAEHEDKETKKCFDDWKEFYLQIFGSIKSKSDLIIAFTHYILMKNGFRCLGLGDDRTYSEDEVGTIYIPEGWSQFSKYSIRYIYNRMLYILLGVHLDHRLLINFLNTRTNVVTNITVFPEITVRATYGGSINVLIPFPEKLAQTLYSNLIQTFTDMQACDRPPKILSRTKQQNNPWDELAARRSKDVYPIMEEDNISDIEESQEVQTLDATKERFNSINSRQAERHASWADVKPQTANIEVMNSLKTRLDETVAPVKDAIVSYVEAMVNNWFRLYGSEIMKSGKLAIQDLTDQRQIIEKYMNFAKPVTEPKSGFVIYNTKVTLDDSKHILLRDTVEKRKMELKSGSNLSLKLKKSLSETTHEPKLTNTKEDNKNNQTAPIGRDEPLVEEAYKVRNRYYYKNVRAKINTGIRNDKNTTNSPPQNIKKTVEIILAADRNAHNAKDNQTTAKASTGLKPVLKKVKPLSGGRTEKENKRVYKAFEVDAAKRNASNNRGKGGTSINSLHSLLNIDGKLKSKRSKLKAGVTAAQNSKNIKNNAVKHSNTNSVSASDSQVKLNRSSPIKKIRFNLLKTSETPSYLSTQWPSTYKSLENLLKSSFPFREQAREPGGSTNTKEFLTKYDLNNDLEEIIFSKDEKNNAETQHKPQKRYIYDLEKSGDNVNDSSVLLQTIEEHFAEQIEAKRLELLEMVRRRDLPSIMDNNENLELNNNFVNMELEEDVGYFVPPADEWAQWEFKKKLKEMREKEMLTAYNKKMNFNET